MITFFIDKPLIIALVVIGVLVLLLIISFAVLGYCKSNEDEATSAGATPSQDRQASKLNIPS